MNHLLRLTIMSFSVITFAACGNSGSKPATSDTTAVTAIPEEKLAPSDTLAGCYLNVSGNKSLDTALLNLKAYGSNVSGDFTTSIYEKDKRKGSFTGVITDSLLKAMWTFSQEGMTDSMPLVFLITTNGLMQKANSLEIKTYKEMIADTAGYRISFKKVDCGGR